MNRIILKHGVYTCVKVDGITTGPVVEPQVVSLPKFAMDQVVNLYEVLPMLSYNADDTMKIISDIDDTRIHINELVKYIAKQAKEQKYNDYNGVAITQEVVKNLRVSYVLIKL